MSKIAAKWIDKDSQSLTADGSNLAVRLVSGGAIEKTANGLTVRVSGITNDMLGGSIDLSKLASTVVTPDGSTAFSANQSVGGNRLTDLARGLSPNDAVNLAQLNDAIAGLDFQPDVNSLIVDSSTSYPGDGTTPAAAVGQRYVINSITDINAAWGTISGIGDGDIIEYDGTEWAVAYDVSERGPGALAWTIDGEYFLRWDGTTWAEFGGLSGVTAGIALEKVGNTINVVINPTNSGLSTAGGLAILIDSIGGGNLAKAISVSANGVAVKVDDNTIEGDPTTGQLRVKSVGPTQVDQTADYAFTGQFDVPTIEGGNSSTKAASTAYVAGEITTFSQDVPAAPNYTPADATIKGHLSGISAKLGIVSARSQETIAIDATIEAAGYFTLAAATDNASSVSVQPTDGPRQINALAVGTSGATPDFTVLNNGAELHINNNGGATGLSGVITAGDILVVEYTRTFA